MILSIQQSLFREDSEGTASVDSKGAYASKARPHLGRSVFQFRGKRTQRHKKHLLSRPLYNRGEDADKPRRERGGKDRNMDDVKAFAKALDALELKKETTRPRGTDSAKVIQVIETLSLRGRGTEEDPVRAISQYWNFEGELLAERDPCFTGKDEIF